MVTQKLKIILRITELHKKTLFSFKVSYIQVLYSARGRQRHLSIKNIHVILNLHTGQTVVANNY